MKNVNWMITDHNIVVNYDGQTHMVPRTDASAPKLIQALKDKSYDDIPNLISQVKRLEEESDGAFTVKDGQVFIDGSPAPAALGRKISDFAAEGLPYEPLVLFTKNVRKNPSFRAVNELYQFLEKNNHPITESGKFIAYKKVRPDFKDIHSGTFDNSPGTVVEMPRNEVNEDPNQTCSRGLHCSNFKYASEHFGTSTDTMLEVEVDPADVVAIPVDYNQAKMRVCKYKVLGVVDKESSVVLRDTTKSSSDYEEDEDDCEEYCADCGDYHLVENDCYEDDYCAADCNDCYEDEEDCEEYPWKDELG